MIFYFPGFVPAQARPTRSPRSACIVQRPDVRVRQTDGQTDGVSVAELHYNGSGMTVLALNSDQV